MTDMHGLPLLKHPSMSCLPCFSVDALLSGREVSPLNPGAPRSLPWFCRQVYFFVVDNSSRQKMNQNSIFLSTEHKPPITLLGNSEN